MFKTSARRRRKKKTQILKIVIVSHSESEWVMVVFQEQATLFFLPWGGNDEDVIASILNQCANSTNDFGCQSMPPSLRERERGPRETARQWGQLHKYFCACTQHPSQALLRSRTSGTGSAEGLADKIAKNTEMLWAWRWPCFPICLQQVYELHLSDTSHCLSWFWEGTVTLCEAFLHVKKQIQKGLKV